MSFKSILNAINATDKDTKHERYDILREDDVYTDTCATVHHYDPDGINYIASMQQKDFIETFLTGSKWKESFENGDTFSGDARKYAKAILSHAKKIKKQKYKLTIKYKYGKHSTSGRLYDDGFGTQILNKELRGYFLPDTYHDYDMSNAHPTLLLWLCKELNLSCERLDEYVGDREAVLQKSKSTKQSILTMINCDKHKKSSNDWVQAFCDELTRNKDKIVAIIANDYNSTEGSKHPLSSKMNKLLCDLENRCLHAGMQAVEADDDTVLMFDGFMTSTELGDSEIDDMNTATELFGVKWCEKSWDKGIVPASYTEQADRSYEQMKAKWEEKHFMVEEPEHVQWAECEDGPEPITRSGSVDASRKYWYNNEDGKKTKFFDTWIEDETARTYRKVAYIPHSRHFPADVPDDVYNTAKPFAFDYISKEDRNPDALPMFKTLINNLSESPEGRDYTLYYLAHMVQKPLERPEVMLFFKSHGGTGKDTLTNTAVAIFGQDHCETIDDMGVVFDRFNSVMANKLFITMNEVDGKQGTAYIEKLKNRLTSERIHITYKNKEPYKQDNFARFWGHSNNPNPIPLDTGVVRRLHANQVPADNLLCEEFFAKYYACLKDKHWVNSLASELCDYDLTQFNVRRPPKSSSLTSKLQDKIQPLHKFLQDICEGKHTLDVYTTIPKKPDCIGIDVASFNRAYKERLQELFPSGWDAFMTDKKYISNVFGNYHSIFTPKVRKSVNGVQKCVHVIDPARMIIGMKNRREYTMPDIDESDDEE